MKGTKVPSRIVALALILVAGMGYILLEALQLPINHPSFPVDLELPATGGLFQGGYVALRGVDVGRISSIVVGRDGVVVHMAISAGTRIPVASTATVRELSAVGEQYVDFTATGDGGPYLTAHSVVKAGAGALPVSVSGLLHDGSGLADSIDTNQVSDVLQTLSAGLAGTGPELRNMLDAATRLSSQLGEATPATNDVLDYGQILEQTGISTDPAVASSATNLAQISAQLKASDSSLRALLAAGPAATSALQKTIAADSAPSSSLLANTATITATMAGDQPALAALFQAMPPMLRALISVATPVGINVTFNFNDKNDICTYPNAPIQVPTATQVLPVDLNRDCNRTAPDLEQRGADNAPRP